MREISEKWKSAMVLWFFYVYIFGLDFSSVNAATDPNDASALKNMYSSMNSAPQLTGWSQNSDDPCGQSWRGIKCSGQRVTEIVLSDLGLSGSIGYQLASLQSVTIFDVSKNNLGGSIPYGIPPKLKRLNLGRNNFNGGVPYSISMIPTLEYLNISHNQLQNQLDNIFTQLTNLKTLDLSFNILTGILPSSLSSLTSIKAMFLQNNQISGTLDVLATLPLDTLNIENNRFTGWVPETLKNINLDMNGNSWNSGPAPPPPPGTPPLTRSSRNRNSGGGNTNSSGGGGKSSGISGGAVAGIVLSLLFVAGIVAFFVVRKKRSRKPSRDIEKLDNEPFAPLASNEVQEMKSVQSILRYDTKTFEVPAAMNLKPPPMERNKSFDDDEIIAKKPIVVKKNITAPTNVTAYTVADLQMATGSFNVDNLLGEASFGRVYRAQFDDGKVLAVTKLDSMTLFCGRNAYESFMNVVINISRLHHPNLTELVGYCSEHEQYLLAYEFHKSGTLHDYLHIADEYIKPLIWNSRVKIALGTARALEYLHEVCSPSVVHKNVNSVNIALDSELNPHLSDCGLANYIPEADQYIGSTVNHGFNAPEILMSAQYSVKSDVYSFGVIMLELLTGRKPFDSSLPRSEQSLVQWASPQLHDIDALSKMVDPALEGLYPVKSLSRFADVIALCIQSEPEFRPPMSEVVQALVRLVQRANMSKRTVGSDQGTSKKGDNEDADY